MANASVTFTIKRPNAALVTGTGTTGVDGSAAYQYRLKGKDPLGTYQVNAHATLSGALTGDDTTTFAVQ